MMTSSDHSNIPTDELDTTSVVDFNKKGNRKEECMIPERSMYGKHATYVCRNLSDHHSIAPHEDSKKKEEINNTMSIGNEGKDKGIGHINSGKFDWDLITLFETHKTLILKDYDLVVIAVGIWEGMRKRDCRMSVLRKNEAGAKN